MDGILNDPAVVLTRHKFSVADYHRMGEAGILTDRDRVELIEGEIITLAPIGQDHYGTANFLTQSLVLACHGRAVVSVANPVILDDWSAPQPDFAVFRFRADFYRTGTPPGPADTMLVVEVSDSSLSYESQVKVPLYAAAGIPEYWIVDLKERVLQVYRQPDGSGYVERTTRRAGDTLALAADPGLTIKLDALFGPS